jgi:hypothetical protein
MFVWIELAARPALIGFAGLLLAATAGAAPLEVYGRLPALEAVAISPDGSRLAYVRTEGDVRDVALAASRWAP